ncbi:hypothetical protein BY458DRAFT_528119 [Sporodiniella umbellata]|nr:hypothetical protein BY458DRAFT_528119 [Sporodiniella umbellata]
MTLFPEFRSFQRRPIITYSRKPRFLSPTPQKELFIPSPPIEPSSSFSSSCSDVLVDDEEEKRDPIFDFPEKQTEEINLMIASTRSLPKSKKPKQAIKKAVKKVKSKATRPAPAGESWDPFSLESIDYSAHVYPTKSMEDSFPTRTHQPSLPYPPPPSLSFNESHSSSPCSILPAPSFSTPTNLLIDPFAFLGTTELLTQPSPCPSTVPLVPKRKKRNLVAQLKSASGEKEKTAWPEFTFSDEEDCPVFSPAFAVPKARSVSPECSYEERMEKELESIMQSEFGQPSSPQSIPPERPSYRPLNEIKVKVTYTKRTAP